jgi:hypothetical protein
MKNRWLKWQPYSTADASALRKTDLTKPTTTDKNRITGGSVSFGSGLSQRKSITRISSPVVGKVSNRERREVTARYLSERNEPIELLPLCTCGAKPYPHDAHSNEKALFERHRSMRLR